MMRLLERAASAICSQARPDLSRSSHPAASTPDNAGFIVSSIRRTNRRSALYEWLTIRPGSVWDASWISSEVIGLLCSNALCSGSCYQTTAGVVVALQRPAPKEGRWRSLCLVPGFCYSLSTFVRSCYGQRSPV